MMNLNDNEDVETMLFEYRKSRDVEKLVEIEEMLDIWY